MALCLCAKREKIVPAGKLSRVKIFRKRNLLEKKNFDEMSSSILIKRIEILRTLIFLVVIKELLLFIYI